jgi:hypothetical protein
MTESDWLASEDPAAMLECFSGRAIPPATSISGRKLRLWVAALYDASEYDYPDTKDLIAFRKGETWDGEGPGDLAGQVQMWSTGQHDNEGDPPFSVRAALLREIIGNPFRPVSLKVRSGDRLTLRSRPTYRLELAGPNDSVNAIAAEDQRADGTIAVYPINAMDQVATWTIEPHPWLTPDVLALAAAAYEERQPDGTLAPDRLAVLADALEDAGHPSEAEAPCPTCAHHYSDQRNPFGVGALGYHPERDPASGRHEGDWTNCKTCNGGGREGVRPGVVRTPHPLLAHLRSSGPHVRGCWAIDLMIGKD